MLCTVMVFFIYVWARRFRRGMQLDAALITAASVIIIGFARGASTDMPLTATFTIAMLSWYGWYESQNRAWLLAFYAFAGLGTLAKGPVAVFLAGLIIVAFAALRRDWRLVLRTLWLPGIMLYLAVVAVVYRRAARQSGVLPRLHSRTQPGAVRDRRLSAQAALLVLLSGCADRVGAVDRVRHHRLGRCRP